ncbi:MULTISPECIES: hypothetical protein [Arthrobacter]|jgi:hypothetical protein|uniref:Uncharacterized protein n=1 Tax=Arthrobacter terricola TaxID=2547396 RepID=A0A4R5KYZ4_9MICC|nr:MULTISPECIES: hypothetical protein [Arthrobacter]MBT8159530.1 hypothetical protein [Arthrobacter sp. GN70]TDG01342.1 hypothetical protein E1809_02205 [Arthrobacter terricola]
MNDNSSFERRLVDLTAVAMIGDGALALLMPAEHMKTWICGPQWWRDLVTFFASRPGLTRLVGAIEICAAVWWVRRSPNASPRS